MSDTTRAEGASTPPQSAENDAPDDCRRSDHVARRCQHFECRECDFAGKRHPCSPHPCKFLMRVTPPVTGHVSVETTVDTYSHLLPKDDA